MGERQGKDETGEAHCPAWPFNLLYLKLLIQALDYICWLLKLPPPTKARESLCSSPAPTNKLMDYTLSGLSRKWQTREPAAWCKLSSSSSKPPFTVGGQHEWAAGRLQTLTLSLICVSDCWADRSPLHEAAAQGRLLALKTLIAQVSKVKTGSFVLML